jgi:predicted nuclease of restriction endonuclease-like (RecB) superfamily
MREGASQSWTTRALEQQIGTLYYKRLLSSSDRTAVEQEASSNLTSLQQVPREFVARPGHARIPRRS